MTESEWIASDLNNGTVMCLIALRLIYMFELHSKYVWSAISDGCLTFAFAVALIQDRTTSNKRIFCV